MTDPRTQTLHQLFERQVDRQPDAPALLGEVATLSYGELDRRSNQLAALLIERGITPGDAVRIALPRSPAFVVAVLASLKAGATYVPIDLGYPAQRLKLLFEDLDADLTLCNSASRSQLPAETGALIEVDQLADADGAAERPDLDLDPGSIAMILYTSGSTGKPKGVRLHHRGMVNRLLWDRETYGFGATDVVLQHAALTFDFAQWELFSALTHGGALVLTRPDLNYEGTYLRDLIQAHGVTIMGSVPSLIKVLLEVPGFDGCTSLRWIVSGGETLEPGVRDRVFARTGAQLLNIYGPTEISISATDFMCSRDDASATIPIGRAITGTTVHVLDPAGQPVAAGALGEIYIGGVGVAAGYHGRPDLTAERFVPDPFSDDPDAMLYRTGDLGQQLPDGSLIFGGRIDNQVKLKGRRIELAEIEVHLTAHPEIRDAVALVTAPETGPRRLVAWAVAERGAAPTTASLNQWLAARLPDWMCPSELRLLNTIPRTPNGKTDRAALLAGLVANQPDRVAAPAEDTVTGTLQEIWCQRLGVPTVGVEQTWIELGGESLAALEVINDIESRLGAKLDLEHLSSNTTIAQLVARLDGVAEASPLSELTVLSEHPGAPLLVLLQPYGRDAGRLAGLADALAPDCSVLVLTTPLSAADQLRPIFETAAAHLETLRPWLDGRELLLGGYSVGGLLALELAYLVRQAGHPARSVWMFDTATPEVMLRSRAVLERRGSTWVGMARTLRRKGLIGSLSWLTSFRRLRRSLSGLSNPGRRDPAIREARRVLSRANHKAIADYYPADHLERVHLVVADDQLSYGSADPKLGWQFVPGAKLTRHALLTTHGSLLLPPALQQLADLIRTHLGEPLPETHAPVVDLKPYDLETVLESAPNKVTLALVQPWGRSANSYSRLSTALAGVCNVVALCDRPENADAADALCARATRHREWLLQHTPADHRLFVGGFSVGGVVALELARQLRAAGRPVERTIMIDAALPALAIAERRTSKQWFGKQRAMLRLLRRLPLKRRLRYLRSYIKRQLVSRDRKRRKFEMSPELVRFREYVSGANFRAIQRYPMSDHQEELLVIKSGEQLQFGPFEPALCWDRYGSGSIEMLELPASHREMLNQKHAPLLAQLIRNALEAPGL